MSKDHVKLVTEPPPEQPAPPAQYPRVHFEPTDQGALVQVLFGPLTAFSQMLPAVVMDDIARRWIEHKKAMLARQGPDLALINHINTHGRND